MQLFALNLLFRAYERAYERPINIRKFGMLFRYNETLIMFPICNFALLKLRR